MSKKSLPAILAMGLAFAQSTTNTPREPFVYRDPENKTGGWDATNYGMRGKTNLTTKQKKQRAKAKAAGKARKSNR